MPPFEPIYNRNVMNALLANGGNGLQPAPETQQQPQGLQPAPPVPLSTQKVQDFHAHFQDTQKVLRDLLKKPDDDMTMKALYTSASDQITKHQLSRGKLGHSATDTIKEMSDPNFPREDEKGNPPPPHAVRKYVQSLFNKNVMLHAMLTMKYGPPMQNNPAPPMTGNQS